MNWNCTEKTVLDVIRSKDPLKKGLPNIHAVISKLILNY